MNCQHSNLKGIHVDKIERTKGIQFNMNYKINNLHKSYMETNTLHIDLCSSRNNLQSMCLHKHCFR